MRWQAACLVTLAVVLVADFAAAEPRDKAAADALFRAARDEIDRGNYASACEKFAESNRLDPAPGTVLNLSICLEKLGRVASAWEGYRQVAEQLRDERVAFAAARSQELESRLPWLTLRLSAQVPKDARVFRDGVELIGPSLGLALPVDPGVHTVKVQLAGHEDATVSVTIGEGERKEVVLNAGKRAAVPVPAVRRVAAQPPPRPAPDRTWAYVAGGAGLTGVATSLVAGGLAWTSKSTLRDHCQGQQCDAAGLAAADEGRTYATVGTIAGVIGVAGLGLSTWLFLAPSQESAHQTRVAASVQQGGVNLSVGGRF